MGELHKGHESSQFSASASYKLSVLRQKLAKKLALLCAVCPAVVQ